MKPVGQEPQTVNMFFFSHALDILSSLSGRWTSFTTFRIEGVSHRECIGARRTLTPLVLLVGRMQGERVWPGRSRAQWG